MDIDKNAPGNLSQQGVTRGTDNEAGLDPRTGKREVPVPGKDKASHEEDMTDVGAADSVASEHPES